MSFDYRHAATLGATGSIDASAGAGQQVPAWRQVITWMLFWPLLCLIARQAPYFAGPARDAVAYTQGAAAGEGVDYHAALYVMMAMEAAFTASAWRSVWSTLRANPVVLAGLVLVFVSALWSGAPATTLRMAIELALSTSFVCFLVVRLSAERLMNLLMFMGVASAALSAFFALAMPRYGVFAGYGGGAWQGICDHKNTLGVSMTYLLTPVFYSSRYGRLHRILYAALILFVIGMSQSKGAWLYTAALLYFVMCQNLIRRFRREEALLLVLVVSLVAGAAILGAIGSMDKIAPMLGKDPSMSGRSDIYREVWHSILKKPLLGYGYGGFWGTSPEVYRIEVSVGFMGIGYAENGLLEVALQLGAVGVGYVLFLLGRAAMQAIRLTSSRSYTPRGGWFLSILFLGVVTNTDAGWLLVSNEFDWALILVACIGLQAETARVRWTEAERSIAPDRATRQLQSCEPVLPSF